MLAAGCRVRHVGYLLCLEAGSVAEAEKGDNLYSSICPILHHVSP